MRRFKMLLFPIQDEDVFAQIKRDIDIYWRDTVKARRLGSDGAYHHISGEDINAQETLIDYDYDEEEEERAAYNEDKVLYHAELEEGYEDGMSDDYDEVEDYEDYHEGADDEDDDEDEIANTPRYGGRYGEYNYKYEYGYVDVDDDEDDDDNDDGGVR